MHGIFGCFPRNDRPGAEDALSQMLMAAGRQASQYSNQQNAASAAAPVSNELKENGRHCVVLIAGHILSADAERRTLTAEDLGRRYLKLDKRFLEGLHGHFVVAILDINKQKTLLASDWMGTHPCYYTEAAGGLVFGSRLSAVTAHPEVSAEIDPQAIYNYIYFHCIPSPQSMYRGIQKLRPGELLQYEKGRLELTSYWKPDYRQTTQADEAALTNELMNALQASVSDAIEDRPTGAFLSGGLDSSTVAGMFAKASDQPVDTFTIGFDIPGYDESGYARISAEHFGTRHHEYFVTPDDVCQIVPSIAERYDEPFGNSSVVPTYFCAKLAKETGMHSLLAGDGGDELFAGNERYVRQKIFEYYWQLPAFARTLLDIPYASLPPLQSIKGPQKLFSYITQAKQRLPDRLQSYNFLHRIQPDEVFQDAYLKQISRDIPLEQWRERYNEPESASSLQRMLYLDWKFTLADNDLMKVNTMCDLAGTDVQYPMLDNRLVDLSIRVPDKLLMPGHRLREFYRKAVHGFLSEETLNKSKHGFGLPFGVWMRDHRNLQELAYDSIQSLKNEAYFDPDFLDSAIRLHKEGAAGYYGELVWILMMLQLWLEKH